MLEALAEDEAGLTAQQTKLSAMAANHSMQTKSVANAGRHDAPLGELTWDERGRADQAKIAARLRDAANPPTRRCGN